MVKAQGRSSEALSNVDYMWKVELEEKRRKLAITSTLLHFLPDSLPDKARSATATN
jgi:hypothetical protein